ncbi:hypothetical protein SHAb15599_00134 [Acinetobacter phage SH-Ab 15599]|nr:hypothetical protein SHAb15599_00134 [Acinetobacter phage SH-Ab 15599]
MTTLTTNQENVLLALAKDTQLLTQPWVSTAEIAEVTGLTKLVTSGLVCSMIHKGLLISLKQKKWDGSRYQYTEEGLAAIQHKLTPVQEKPAKQRTKYVTFAGQRITENQAAVIKALAYSQYTQANGAPETAQSIDELSTWLYVDEIAKECGMTVKTAKAVVGTLVKSGYYTVAEDEDNIACPTELGFEIIKAMVQK